MVAADASASRLRELLDGAVAYIAGTGAVTYAAYLGREAAES